MFFKYYYLQSRYNLTWIRERGPYFCHDRKFEVLVAVYGMIFVSWFGASVFFADDSIWIIVSRYSSADYAKYNSFQSITVICCFLVLLFWHMFREIRRKARSRSLSLSGPVSSCCFEVDLLLQTGTSQRNFN